RTSLAIRRNSGSIFDITATTNESRQSTCARTERARPFEASVATRHYPGCIGPPARRRARKLGSSALEPNRNPSRVGGRTPILPYRCLRTECCNGTEVHPCQPLGHPTRATIRLRRGALQCIFESLWRTTSSEGQPPELKSPLYGDRRRRSSR